MVLKIVGGVPVWSNDLTVGGEVGLWGTSTDSLAIRPNNINQVVLIGTNATTSNMTNLIMEVAGDSYFSGNISAQSLSLVNALAVNQGGTGSSSPSGLLYGDGAGNIVSLQNNK